MQFFWFLPTHGDGEYLGRPESRGRFDLIIADRPDPVGPGKALFGETFYDRVLGALRPGGFSGKPRRAATRRQRSERRARPRP